MFVLRLAVLVAAACTTDAFTPSATPGLRAIGGYVFGGIVPLQERGPRLGLALSASKKGKGGGGKKKKENKESSPAPASGKKYAPKQEGIDDDVEGVSIMTLTPFDDHEFRFIGTPVDVTTPHLPLSKDESPMDDDAMMKASMMGNFNPSAGAPMAKGAEGMEMPGLPGMKFTVTPWSRPCVNIWQLAT